MIPQAIGDYLKSRFSIIGAEALSGGCINHCYKLITNKGNFFIKYNSTAKYPCMFEAESAGLQLMHSTRTVNVPGVIETGEVDGHSFLLTDFIERGSANNNTLLDLGRQLAAMHRCSRPDFGLDIDNYIGSLPQDNSACKLWHDFFVQHRLKPMIAIAVEAGSLTAKDVINFERLFDRLTGLFTEEKPALLHGDLWSGNYLIDKTGKAFLIDPAVYYGHREMDIAMTQLFGGFNAAFYQGYNEVFPLQNGWQQRVDLWNLYPLLVHVNLFGGGYLGQLRAALGKYL